jgi:DNA/RNA-binding domain of Phe-tRNA-synthetase-like protein
MILISASDAWRTAHPGALIGLLEISGVENMPASPALNQHKRETETRLRQAFNSFTRQDFLALPILSAYERYYKRFSKTYHVLLQVESIVLKGKDLPEVLPLVDANFAAEVETFVLTAGHDVAKLCEPISMDIAREGDLMTLMNGTVKVSLVGDMIMRDAQGLCCSIIHGQDNISPISPGTNHVLYVAYSPPGVPVQAVEAQLQKIEEYVRLFSPLAVLEQRRLLIA